jgi:hypothetical protein
MTLFPHEPHIPAAKKISFEEKLFPFSRETLFLELFRKSVLSREYATRKEWFGDPCKCY